MELTDNPYACYVVFYGLSNGHMEHCIVRSLGSGVQLCYAHHCTLDSNTIEGGLEALTLISSYNCTITNNDLPKGGVGFGTVDDANLEQAFFNNTVMGREFGYFSKVTGQHIDAASFGQVVIVGSSDLVIQGGDITNLSCGVLLVGSKDCILDSFKVSRTTLGVCICACYNVTVSASSIVANTYNGLSIFNTNTTAIRGNHIYSNGQNGIEHSGLELTISDNDIRQNYCGILAYGVDLGGKTSLGLIAGNVIKANMRYGILLGQDATGYTIYNNSIAFNGINAWDGGTKNSWDNGAGVGNAWDDYNGSGDYRIGGNAGSLDHYPSGRVDYYPITPIAAGFVLWCLFSAAVLSVPVFLTIQRRRALSD